MTNADGVDPAAQRGAVRFITTFVIAAGLCVAFSPLAFDYDSAWSPVLAGSMTVAAAAAAALVAPRLTGLSYLSAGLGLWTFASAFWLDADTIARLTCGSSAR